MLPNWNCDTKYYPATTYNQHTARTGDEGPCLIGNHKTTYTSWISATTTTGKRTDTTDKEIDTGPVHQKSLLKL